MPLLINRRSAIQSALASFFSAPLAIGRASAIPFEFFERLGGKGISEAAAQSSKNLPVAASFGVHAASLVDPQSRYRVPAQPSQQDRLCFDVSNNRIACSINMRGLLERITVQLGVEPVETKTTPVGAYVNKVLDRSGPWPLSIKIGDAAPLRLDGLPQPDIRLLDNLLPAYTWSLHENTLRMTVFAPQTTDTALPLLCVALRLQDSDARNRAFSVTLPLEADVNPPAVCEERAGTWKHATLDVPFTCNGEMVLALAVAPEANADATLLHRLALHSGSEWQQKTMEYHRARYGALSIPEAPFYAELLVRAAELSRQSLLLDAHDEFGGSFNGSDLPPASNVWLRDCFYSTLPQASFAPELCGKASLFFLKWSIPTQSLGEHAAKFANASGVTNSLGNSVAGIVLAGAYFDATADRAFFQRHPEVLQRSQEILERVLASRFEEPFLFPSIYVSDGESRGDFHTGSNIFLWKAMASFSRLAREIGRDHALAETWASHASDLKTAILERCTVNEAEGVRFVEGAMQDQTQISGHDGEESDVTLAAAYGFCQPDDSRYTNAGRYAMTRANPYFSPEVEGIWWHAHGRWSSATFPGWITALAGARDESELAQRLDCIRKLTDADGSFWWWPYLHAEFQIEHPSRRNSKCGWAAGTFVTYMLHQVLGISVDAVQREVRFCPFSPWKSFEWKQCRVGVLQFSVAYAVGDDEVTLEIQNLSDGQVMASLQAIAPLGTTLDSQRLGDLSGRRIGESYGRQSLSVNVSVPPGKKAVCRLPFRR